MTEPLDWPLQKPDEDIWSFLHRAHGWRSPCIIAGRVMRLADVTLEAVGERSGVGRDQADYVSRGQSHDLPGSIRVCQAVDDLVRERWSGIPPGNELAAALIELRQLMELMHATRRMSGGYSPETMKVLKNLKPTRRRPQGYIESEPEDDDEH